MCDSRKRRTMAESTSDTDRMSGLPDSELFHILPFLPTKTCMATSILSRRWRHLWEYLQVLDFHKALVFPIRDDDLEPFGRFADFVNAVLALRRSRDIRKMRLTCWSEGEDAFSSALTPSPRGSVPPLDPASKN